MMNTTSGETLHLRAPDPRSIVRALVEIVEDVRTVHSYQLGSSGLRVLLDLALLVVSVLRWGVLREALDRALDPENDLEVVEEIKQALRARVILEEVADRLDDPHLRRELSEMDAELSKHETALDVLDDEEYSEAVGGAPLQETSWWGRRAYYIRMLPLDHLQTLLASACNDNEYSELETFHVPALPKDGEAEIVAVDDVIFHAEPVSDIPLEDAVGVHEAFMEGLRPSRDVLRDMLERDWVFCASSGGTPVALVHVRIVRPGSSLGATDIEERDGRGAGDELYPCLRAADHFVVCHAAVTHPQHRKARITQRLITSVVLPYLAAHPQTRALPWYTSSPLTHFVTTGRRMAEGPALAEIVRACELAVLEVRPDGWSSLAQILERAKPWLVSHGLCEERALPSRSFQARVSLFADLYSRLPTHEELVDLRRPDSKGGNAEARRLALSASERVRALHTLPRDPSLGVAHAASMVVLLFAAAFSQAGVFDERGKPVDPVLAFHFDNGATLSPEAGPLPSARRADIAALQFGQVLEYSRDWKDRQSENRRLFAQRAAACRSVGVDSEVARRYLVSCARRVDALIRQAGRYPHVRPAKLDRRGAVISAEA